MNLRQTLVFLIALSSCTGKPEGWTSGKIASASFTCSHLTFPAKNLYRDLEIYFQRDGEQVYVYLNIYSIPFVSDSEGMVMISIEIDDDKAIFKAPVLAGNQRLLLPQAARELLLNALNEKHTIVVRAGKYSAEVHSESFGEAFQQF